MQRIRNLAMIVALGGLLAASPAEAVFIGNAQGGTDFPEGAASFADQLVDYAPVVKNGEPSAANSEPTKALGVPDYFSGGGCVDPLTCTFVSLGDGGSITLRFTDNVLTGSDNNALDLWIFEVGPDVEDTFVEISVDGASWTPVGKVFGSTAGIDIDAFGFGASSSFAYVRLTDDGAEGDQTGASVGADIDAVGAISTRIVPEPSGFALVAMGVGALASRRRRRGGATRRSRDALVVARVVKGFTDVHGVRSIGLTACCFVPPWIASAEACGIMARRPPPRS